MMHRSLLVSVRGAAAASATLPAAPSAAVRCAASTMQHSHGRMFSAASTDKPKRPDLPRAQMPPRPSSAVNGLERADHRPTGRTRGYASSDAELEARASALARDRSAYEDIVADALEVEHVQEKNSGHGAGATWDMNKPLPPSFKSQASTSRYTNEEIPGFAFQDPLHKNDPRAVHGVGTPQQKLVQRPRLRRETRPKSVQDVPTPMKTYTDGPRELGNTIVRTYVGHVVSDKMNKTVAVEVSQYYRHPKYHKYIKTSRKFLTHDEAEECNIGDVVEIRVCRPMSKRKHFTLHRILKPKLAIEEGARRFEANLPAWRKPGLDADAQAALELSKGEEALQAEKDLAEQKIQAAAAKGAEEAALPAAIAAAQQIYEQLESEAAAAARAFADVKASTSPAERLENKAIAAAEAAAIAKATKVIEALEVVNTLKAGLKPTAWASS